MAITKTTSSFYSKTGMNPGTSTKDMYTTTDLSNLENALKSVFQGKYEITKVMLNVTASFTAGLGSNVKIQFGLGSTDNIVETIQSQDQIGSTKTSGSETYSKDITKYFADKRSYSITRSYGSLLVFRMQSNNISSKKYSIDSVTLTVTWNNCYTIVFENWDRTVLQEETLVEGTTPTYKGVAPTRARDLEYTYVWSELNPWVPIPYTVTSDKTYTAYFDKTPREYEVAITCDDTKLVAEGAGVYKFGDTVTLYMPDTPRAEFAYWVFENRRYFEVNPFTFTLNEDFVLSVDVEKITFRLSYDYILYTLTTNCSPTDGGVIKRYSDGYSNGQYLYGTMFAIEAIPNKGYKFIKWSDGDTEKEKVITITGNVSYTAYFKADKINYIYADTSLSSMVSADSIEDIEIYADKTKVYG